MFTSFLESVFKKNSKITPEEQKQQNEVPLEVAKSSFKPNNTVHIAIKLVVFVWLFIYGIFALVFIFNGLFFDYSWLSDVIPTNKDLAFNMRKLLFVVNGSILGIFVLGMSSFHKYVSVKQEFKKNHIWGYFIAPLLASIVSIIIFALFEIGFSTMDLKFDTQTLEIKTKFSLIVIGFVSGFGWSSAIRKFYRTVSQLISKGHPRNRNYENKEKNEDNV